MNLIGMTNHPIVGDKRGHDVGVVKKFKKYILKSLKREKMVI